MAKNIRANLLGDLVPHLILPLSQLVVEYAAICNLKISQNNGKRVFDLNCSDHHKKFKACIPRQLLNDFALQKDCLDNWCIHAEDQTIHEIRMIHRKLDRRCAHHYQASEKDVLLYLTE